ncbi:MAG: hypothetical protein WA708_10740 [Acidobacteriaceae bacterium]
MQTKLERDVRNLKIYAGFLTIFLICVAVFALRSPRIRHFNDIDVHRINIREKNGKLDLVISNSAQMPPAIVNGTAFPNGRRSPGMLFYNGKGDEDGGLAFSSHALPNGGYSADGQLMFDQYNQDQEVGIEYQDNNGKRVAGLHVWDRSNTPLDQVIAQFKGMSRAERNAALRKSAAAGTPLVATRVFVGKQPDKSSQVMLADAQGRPRLVMIVQASGDAEIQFLDENGKVVKSISASPAATERGH